MKPFNLERAIAGDPLVTRCGRKAEFIAHRPQLKPGCRLMCLTHVGSETPMWLMYHEDGKYVMTGSTNYDLFMTPIEKTLWANVYTGLRSNAMPVLYFYHTQEEADKQGNASTRAGGRAFPFTYTE